MPNDDRDDPRLEGTERPPTTRRAGAVRALVMTALAALAPAAGCYDSSDPAEDAEYDADASDAADAARDDGGVLPYGAPAYGVPDAGETTGPVYGTPEYGSP
jgi:hypothetical protein